MAIEIPPPGTYSVVPDQSEIRFSVKHRFGTGTVHGTFRLLDGTITVEDPTGQSTVAITVDSASFESGNASRDAKVRSATFLDVARFPNLTFVSSAVEPDDRQIWQLRGDLTAHGVTSPTAFTVDGSRSSGDLVCLEATGAVDRYAHDVTAMKGMAGRWLNLTITLCAERRPSP